MKINKKMIDLISELSKNAKKSDRDIAKILNISQPTVTRMRKKLEDKGYISEYTTVLDIAKLGFEIVAFTFFKTKKTGGKRIKSAAHDMITQHPKVIFAGFGHGLSGQNSLLVSLHKNFTDYTEFSNEIKKKWRENITDVESFLVTLKSFTPKFLSFRDVGKLLKESRNLNK